MHLVQRKTCRICGSSALTPVIDLGPQYLQGSFVKPDEPAPPQRRIPCTLVRCDPTRDERACGLLQMSHSVPPELLYSVYWYQSGTNHTMRSHLAGIAGEVGTLLGRETATVLDIGCNDGTLLASYPATYNRIGVDPSDIAEEARRFGRVYRDLFPSVELGRDLGAQSCDAVTSIAMFYDLEDPGGFCREVGRLLKPDGCWVFEMSYMPLMLEMNSYDTICHEHLEYYSLAVIERLLRESGLKLFRVGLNTINGGSLRCFATPQANPGFRNETWLGELRSLRIREFDLALDTDAPYRSFQDRINLHREELVSLLKGLRATGKRIHLYGASTKGNTILQWCGIDGRLIEAAADRNPRKHGARTLGTDIPILSEVESRAMAPDYYLVLPWHFKGEFLEREAAMLEAGVGFIFPLPRVEVVRREGAGRLPVFPG
jgi:SAM-dependent methyltransferase